MTRKRSQHINLAKMRKATSAWKPLALAIAGASLAACSDHQEEVRLVESIDDCTSNTELTQQQCEAAYQQAVQEAARTAPRFEREQDCQAVYGFDSCRATSNGWFMPMMTGFLISKTLDALSDSRQARYTPIFRDRDWNKHMSDGTPLSYSSGGWGSYRIPEGSNTAKTTVSKPYPAGTKTINRGGFGSTSSAKSSWGGGKSSGSWGG